MFQNGRIVKFTPASSNDCSAVLGEQASSLLQAANHFETFNRTPYKIEALMENIFFLDANKQKVGPLKASELLSRGVTPSTLVWMPGLTQWTPAGNVPQLQAIFSAQQAGAEQSGYTSEPQGTYGTAENNASTAYENNAYATGNQQPIYAAQQNSAQGVNVCGAIGMTLAILLFVIWIPGVGLAISWLVALIFSIVGVCRPQKGMAIAGLVITVLLLLVGIFSLIFGLSFFSKMF